VPNTYTAFQSRRALSRFWQDAAAICLAIILGGAGCASEPSPLVIHPTATPGNRRFEPIAPAAASKRKISLFKRPAFAPEDVERVYQSAADGVPGANTFQSSRENAVLRIYPSFRLPIYYTLNFSVSGTAGRTSPANTTDAHTHSRAVK
jgi:hypothetical protein